MRRVRFDVPDLFPPRLRDLRKFKEAKKQFDKVSEEKEAALTKNAQAPRNKQHEVEIGRAHV